MATVDGTMGQRLGSSWAIFVRDPDSRVRENILKGCKRGRLVM